MQCIQFSTNRRYLFATIESFEKLLSKFQKNLYILYLYMYALAAKG